MPLTTSPVDGVTDAVRAMLDEQLDVPSNDTLLAEIEQLLTLENQVKAAITERLAVADTREATLVECGQTTKSWLVESNCVDRADAGRKVFLARRLHHWPATVEAWRAGDISDSHVSVIFKALYDVPVQHQATVERALIDLARTCAPHLLSEAVDMLLVACGVERSSDEAAAKRHAKRGFGIARTFGGSGVPHGNLTPVLVDKALRVLGELAKPAGVDDDRTQSQRMHDALETVFDHFIDTSSAMPEQVNGEKAARVIVTIPLEVLERRVADSARGWGLLPDGLRIGPETARRLACDAEVIPVVLGGKSKIVDVGRAQRLFTEEVRRLAVIRDGDRCVFPDCQRPRKQCHHIEHWADGGRSDLRNAAWLCDFHHFLVHERGWSMWREADGGYTFRSPQGRRRTSSTLSPPKVSPSPCASMRC